MAEGVADSNPSREGKLNEVLILLGKALQLLDGTDECSVIAAKLQGIIDEVRSERDG